MPSSKTKHNDRTWPICLFADHLPIERCEFHSYDFFQMIQYVHNAIPSPVYGKIATIFDGWDYHKKSTSIEYNQPNSEPV